MALFRIEGGKDATVVVPAEIWAQEQFGSVQLGDKRRTRRAVKVAEAMAKDPAGSIPRQNVSWDQIKGAYRLFDSEQATFEAMLDPHWRRTRLSMGEADSSGPTLTRTVLLLQDATTLDYTHRSDCGGLGRFGRGERWEGGQGLWLHNVLAVEPAGEDQTKVLGLAWNKLWARQQPVRTKAATAKERRQGECESVRWIEAVHEIGSAPPGVKYVHVGDREADIYPLYEACRKQKVSFLVRVSKLNRCAVSGHATEPLKLADRPKTNLLQVVESLPTLGKHEVEVPPRHGRKGRRARCRLSGGPVTIYSSRQDSRTARPLCCWAVRVQEIDPPQGATPIDWVLLCDEPVTSRDDAIRLSGWYARRWLIEEYHKCLKTGCRVEDRQLEHADRLSPLIGMLCVLATRLLTLKTNARVTPDAPAIRHVPRQSVDTLARMLKCDASRMTLRTFTHEVAKLGGFIGRRSDGNPGFQTLWHGLQQLDLISYGIRLGRCG